MFIPLIIAISYCLGFFLESMLGFGGGLIAYAILGFFIDVKQIVLAGLYIGTCASAYIAISDWQSFDGKNFFSKLPICLAGTIIGTFIFGYINAGSLAFWLGVLLIFLSLKITFFDKIKLPRIFEAKLLLIGGIAHGMFGMGGPFVVNALKDNFKNKSHLRTTMAVFFVFFNIIRFTQLSITGNLDWHLIDSIWWAVIPVFMAIKLGHIFHLKISEAQFKKMIALITICSGIKFLIN
ncbi:MAG: sulfite exporter TauE/SafE family protein [Pseudomonadota bacterium]